MEQTTIEAENYGDLLAKVFDMKLVAYQTYGDYQGEYLAVLNDEGVYKFYEGNYGSCSGCDWFEAEANYEDGKYIIDYKVALEFCQNHIFTYAIPKSIWKQLTNSQKQELVKEDSYHEEEMKKEIIKIK